MLRRLDHTPFATYGTLLDSEERITAVTLEDPYVDANHDGLTDRGVSCIPPGSYTAHRRLATATRHGYDVFELEHVPGRSVIQLHIGNLPRDTEGCILLGSNFGQVDAKPGIVGSQAAFARFMSRLVGVDVITLTVVAPVIPGAAPTH